MSASLRDSIHYAWAQTLLFFGANRAARRAFGEVVREQPRNAEAWSVLAYLHAQAGEMSEAVPAYEKALALRPGDADLCFNAGFAAQRAGHHVRAMELLQQAIAMNANLDRAWYGLGLSLAHGARYEEAAEKFREAGRLQPFNPYAGYHLAAVLHKLGRSEEVRSEYERVKGFDPKVSALMRREFGIHDPDAQ